MIPLILGFAASGLGALGFAQGKSGLDKIEQARRRAKLAQKQYQGSIDRLNRQWEETNRLSELYNKLRVRVGYRVVSRFIKFIQRNGKKASYTEQRLIETLDGVSLQDLKEFKSIAFDSEQVMKGVRNAASAGISAGSATVGVANAVGTVAVPQFFGLFAKQVGVAQLGLPGVAAYLGGGNILLGGAVLGGATLGPAIAIAGFQLSGHGEKALTEARRYEAKVSKQIEKNKTAEELLVQTEKRIRELGRLIRKLESRATCCLEGIEAEEKAFYKPWRKRWRSFKLFVRNAYSKLLYGHPIEDTENPPEAFDLSQHVSEFQEIALLVKALVEIVKVPVLDDEGVVTEDSAEIQTRYQSI
jgi:hypothetical protein